MAVQACETDVKGVTTASALLDKPERAPGGRWCLDALMGRFVELTGSEATAGLTAAGALIVETQRRGELAAWVGSRRSIFFPPDFAAMGVDLEALPVVQAEDAVASARAADTLLRTGSFTLIVMDLAPRSHLPLAVQTRLVGLANKHRTVLTCLTRNVGHDAPLGSLVSLRGETSRRRSDFDRFTYDIDVIKDKRWGPGWGCTEVCCGPNGLC